MQLKKEKFSSGAPLEEKIGYSRMIKTGPFIYIGGTTSVQTDGSVYGENSAYEQTKYILEKQVKLLEKAEAVAENTVSVKVYTTDMKLIGDISKAYSEIFFEIKPLFTVVGTPALNRPSQLVEIELFAVLPEC
jgi:enamine deaminase RidA (YjgF/YER057c/UK114 family)